jgi:hypothetical protein
MYVLTATNRITQVISTHVSIIAVNYNTFQAGSSSVTGFCTITVHTIRTGASCLFILTVCVTAISIYGIAIITLLTCFNNTISALWQWSVTLSMAFIADRPYVTFMEILP